MEKKLKNLAGKLGNFGKVESALLTLPLVKSPRDYFNKMK